MEENITYKLRTVNENIINICNVLQGILPAILHESAELDANQICIVHLQSHIYTCLS